MGFKSFEVEYMIYRMKVELISNMFKTTVIEGN